MAPADLRHSIANNSREDGVWPEYVPVLIIGGGPVGLLQALLLSRLGGRFFWTFYDDRYDINPYIQQDIGTIAAVLARCHMTSL
jgi:threonine dehydrogenase-like Zn-dependent dehydrogenase